MPDIEGYKVKDVDCSKTCRWSFALVGWPIMCRAWPSRKEADEASVSPLGWCPRFERKEK